MLLSPGEVIADKYRVEHALGSGGMGMVVCARHLELDDLVAIKAMHPRAAADPALSQRFLREARTAVKLKGMHVARIMDVGRLPDGAPYIVMEKLAGEDLRKVLTSRGRLPVEEAAGLLLQACDAIAEAHAAGIVHRDLKPANFFLAAQSGGDPILKVLDFGISKSRSSGGAASAPEPDLTNSHAMLGTVRYMSPEQMRSSRDVDHRTDIWSLGITLYELLAGRTPFTGITAHEISAQVLRDVPPRCKELVPTLPEALDAVVMRCLEKEPGDRFSTVGELAEGLAPSHPRAHAWDWSVSGTCAQTCPCACGLGARRLRRGRQPRRRGLVHHTSDRIGGEPGAPPGERPRTDR
ncbi:MAG: serine/threonine-protein kinase [Polyangiaceae bacterium]